MRVQLGNRLRPREERITLLRAVTSIVTVAVGLSLVAALVEWAVDPTFTRFGQSVWWAVSTVSTVGYGDVVPQTAAGRVVAGILMLIGLAIIPLVTSVVVSVLLSRTSRAERLRLEAEREELREQLRRIEQLLDRSA